MSQRVETPIQKAFVLYVPGASLESVRQLDTIAELAQHGALVELEPTPITNPQSHYYQAFSGRIPATFGFFDTLMPLSHLPHAKQTSQQDVNGYTVVEELTGRDVPPRTLPDILRTVGWKVSYEELAPKDLAARAQALTSASSSSAVILRLALDANEEISATSPAGQAIVDALKVAQAWAGEAGLVALLSDGAPAPVKQFVNVNNFLVELELMELDEQGAIDWENSVAYFAGHGQLWINLIGRDPEGAVSPQDEYEEFCETLMKALPAKLRAENGETVIEHIYRKDALYSGDYLFCAPDLVIVFKPGYAPSPKSTRLELDATTFTTPPDGTTSRAGIHPSSTRGFLLAAAPMLKAGSAVPEAAALSSAVPSLLHALTIAYNDADSIAISALFSPSYLEAHPVREVVRSNELSDEDEELVIERLRDLGYV